jgi:hypothetical protein
MNEIVDDIRAGLISSDKKIVRSALRTFVQKIIVNRQDDKLTVRSSTSFPVILVVL